MWFSSRDRERAERMERELRAIRTGIEELLARPVQDYAATAEAHSKLFMAGVEASKVQSMQAEPIFLNAEARMGVRRVAEARGIAEVNEHLHDPSNAKFLNDGLCGRDE